MSEVKLSMSNAVWPDPTEEMLKDPAFNAIWETIKTWDINVPHAYEGYCGATGNHVRAILAALSQLAEARGEMERLSKPSTIFAGIDFSMGESKSSWGCTCGRWGKTQFALYEGCTRAECPGRRPSPPSEKGEGK